MEKLLFKWKHYKSDIIIQCLCFKSFSSACETIAGIEVIYMKHKGQAGTSNVTKTVTLINQLFGVA